jgi:hypothetical protein
MTIRADGEGSEKKIPGSGGGAMLPGCFSAQLSKDIQSHILRNSVAVSYRTQHREFWNLQPANVRNIHVLAMRRGLSSSDGKTVTAYVADAIAVLCNGEGRKC